ncbi:MAG TPA: cytochrome b6-f complex subunit PetL [Candidatus Obscuribacterales bacterium]
MSVSGAIAFVVLLGAGFGTAMVLYFGLRAVKLI